jgi:hypothetical protein
VLDANQPIDVGGSPVPLKVDGDDLVAGGQRRQIVTEHFDRSQPAVEQYQWLAVAVNLVLEMQAVYIRIMARGGRRGS